MSDVLVNTTFNYKIDQFLIGVEAANKEVLQALGEFGVEKVQDELIKNGSYISGNLHNGIGYSTEDYSSPVFNTTGKPLEKAEKDSVRIGGNADTIPYLMRIEYGFVGRDSLGRIYNQIAKPFIRLLNNYKSEMFKIVVNRFGRYLK